MIGARWARQAKRIKLAGVVILAKPTKAGWADRTKQVKLARRIRRTRWVKHSLSFTFYTIQLIQPKELNDPE